MGFPLLACRSEADAGCSGGSGEPGRDGDGCVDELLEVHVDGGLPALRVGSGQVLHVKGAGMGDSAGALGGEVAEDAAVSGFAPGDHGCADSFGPRFRSAAEGPASGERFDAPAGESV